MFHSQELNARINRLQEWALRVAYGDFEALLSNENSTTFDQRNLQKANDRDI